METLAAHPHPTVIVEKGKKQDGDKEQPAANAAEAPAPSADDTPAPTAVEVKQGFAGMEIKGQMFTDRTEAGKALLAACQEVKAEESIDIGTYRGFAMSLSQKGFFGGVKLTLKGEMTHLVDLSEAIVGNITRIDKELEQMPERLQGVEAHLQTLYQQQAAAKAELGKPFPKEEELRVKSARLAELDVALNIDRGPAQEEQISAKSARPSVLAKLKETPPAHGAPKKLSAKNKEER